MRTLAVTLVLVLCLATAAAADVAQIFNAGVEAFNAGDFAAAAAQFKQVTEQEPDLAAGFTMYGNHVEFLGFVLTHGNVVRKHSAYTAKAMYEQYQSSGVSGHTHRLGRYSKTDMHSRSHTWLEQGPLPSASYTSLYRTSRRLFFSNAV